MGCTNSQPISQHEANGGPKQGSKSGSHHGEHEGRLFWMVQRHADKNQRCLLLLLHTVATSVSTKASTTGAAAHTNDRAVAGWKVHPGYSSGASSCAEEESDEETAIINTPNMKRECSVSCLEDLKQRMGAEKDLTKTVVRIEVRFNYGSTWTAVFSPPSVALLGGFA